MSFLIKNQEAKGLLSLEGELLALQISLLAIQPSLLADQKIYSFHRSYLTEKSAPSAMARFCTFIHFLITSQLLCESVLEALRRYKACILSRSTYVHLFHRHQNSMMEC